MKMKKALIAVFSMALLLISCGQKNDITTFYLVRHAEKAERNTMLNKDENPPLTEKGKARANRLRELLGQQEIASIYSTSYNRNMNTVKPLADAKNISIENYEWHKWQPMLDEALANHTGKTVLICGHGDNLLPMIEYLGGNKPQESLGPHEYDKIFKVEVGSQATKVEVIHY